MPAALAKMYETLTEQQQEKAYNFIFALYQENTQKKSSAKEIDDAFGMWKNRADIDDVDAFSRSLRRGRNFDY